jgi:tRNA-dihydrouridine synthase B
MTSPEHVFTATAPAPSLAEPRPALAALRALMIDRGGLGLVCTEFVRITKEALPRKHLQRQVVRDPRCPLSVQVMGNAAERMAEAAEIVADAGADVVDINLGCPMPRVVRKGVGAAMLKDVAMLERVLGMMRKATRGLLSAKIRAGFDDSANVLTIAKAIEASGVDFITVHPRRRSDFYQGVADWRIIASVKRALRIPVVGNGDVWYAADALRMQQETGCDAVMIGRPALRNPFIFRQIDELRRGAAPFSPDGAQLLHTLQLTFARYGEYYGELQRSPLGPIKEILSWVGRAVNDKLSFRSQVLRQNTLPEVLSVMEQHLAPLSADALDLAANGHLGLERSGSAYEAKHGQA